MYFMNKRTVFSLFFSFLLGLLLLQALTAVLSPPTTISATTVNKTAVSIQNDTPSQLQFTLRTETAVNTDGLVQIEGLDQQTQIAGEPALPYYSTWIALPPNGTAVIDVQSSDKHIFEETTVSPAKNELPDLEMWATLNEEEALALPIMDLMEKASVYQQNKLYPAVTYDLSEPMHLRDLRLVELRLYPVRYNPVSSAMEQATQMDVTVSIIGASENGVEKRQFTTNSQADAFADHILNYEQSKAWRHFPAAVTNDIQLPIGQETFKITLDQDGLYDISRAQLDSGINPQTIEMMYRGEPVAYDIVNDNGDTIFDADEKIRFYGWAFDSHSIGNSFAEYQFINDNVYWLWADGTPTRIVYENSESGHPAQTTFPKRLIFDPELDFFNTWTNIWPDENKQDAWYWEKVTQSTDILTRTYPITLPFPAMNGSSNITYTVELLSRESAPPYHTTFTYTVRGQLNEYPVQPEVSWYQRGNVDLVGTQPISSLNALNNEMHVIFATDLTLSGGNPKIYLNDITVEYARELVATNDQLFFGQTVAGAHNFQVTGFDEGDAAKTAVWDITDPLTPIAITLTNANISGTGPYTYTIGQTYGENGRFLATTDSNILSAAVTTYTPPDLDPVNGADWIAITPDVFSSGANSLAAHRQDPTYGGHETAVINIDDIVNQYGYGLPLPAAISDYLTHSLTNWATPPRYVTLVGNGSHSPRGLPCTLCSKPWATEDVVSYIPTDLLFIDRWQGMIPTDYTYTTLIGDDLLPDIAIGRLTVSSTIELTAVINKIIKYEENLNANPAWINNILFVADDADDAGNFPAANAATAARLPAEYNTTLLEQTDPADVATLRADMGSHINVIGGGVSILNYRGHGSINRWASPAILDTSVDFWNNDSSPLIILSADCLDGYYAWPNYESLGRDFLTRQFVGSAAHWSSSGLGLTAEHTVLHQAFYDGVFDHQYGSIGDAANYAKIIYAQSSYIPSGKSELYTFNLQGDPAMNVVPNRPGELQFEQANPTVLENAGTATITISRTLGRNGAASVEYATSNGTAIAGDDYVATSGTLTFADGEMSKTFTITILDNSIIENDKTVNLILTNVTGATAGDPMQSTLTIINDDATVQFTQTDYTVSENDGAATITVSRMGYSDSIISVDYSTNDGTAIAGSDYITASGTLTFIAGEMSKTFTITILNDGNVESDKTVNLTISNPTGGGTLGNPETAVLTILNDDATLQFAQPNFVGLESAGEATITVSRIGYSNSTVSVDYTTSDGTAIAGSDYITASGTLTFTAGEMSKTFLITILNDGDTEDDETVNLTISNPTNGASLGIPEEATLTIQDDGSTIQFAQANFIAPENAGAVTITVTRAGDDIGEMSVNYATSDGTAIAGSDYITASGTLTFMAGETNKTFTVTVLNDANSESNEVVNLTLSNVTNGGTLGTPHPAVLTITNIHVVYLPTVIK